MSACTGFACLLQVSGWERMNLFELNKKTAEHSAAPGPT